MTAALLISEEYRMDLKAFEILVREHHRRILAYALSLTQRSDVAEDLVQDAFVVAFRKLDQFDPNRNFGSWVRGIVRFKYFEWTRKQRLCTMDEQTLEVLDLRYREWDESVEEGLGDMLEALRQCLRKLKERARQTIALFYEERLSCLEIAERMNASESAVKKRLERIRNQLQQCIQFRISSEGQTV